MGVWLLAENIRETLPDKMPIEEQKPKRKHRSLGGSSPRASPLLCSDSLYDVRLFSEGQDPAEGSTYGALSGRCSRRRQTSASEDFSLHISKRASWLTIFNLRSVSQTASTSRIRRLPLAARRMRGRISRQNLFSVWRNSHRSSPRLVRILLTVSLRIQRTVQSRRVKKGAFPFRPSRAARKRGASCWSVT